MVEKLLHIITLFKDNSKILSNDSIDCWIKKIGKIDEFRYKGFENQLKKYVCTNVWSRLTLIIQNQSTLMSGTEVYYPTKKLSNKAEGYSSKLALCYSRLTFVKRMIGSMIVELTDRFGKNVREILHQ